MRQTGGSRLPFEWVIRLGYACCTHVVAYVNLGPMSSIGFNASHMRRWCQARDLVVCTDTVCINASHSTETFVAMMQKQLSLIGWTDWTHGWQCKRAVPCLAQQNAAAGFANKLCMYLAT